MKKLLVFGAYGMAGHMITTYLDTLNKYKIYSVCHNSKLNENSTLLNVFDINKVHEIVLNINPDIIINCIGVLNDKSDLDIKETVFINSFFPHLLENIGLIENIKIIHLSTDCVFSGKKGSYTEVDIKDELGSYGLSKNLGEIINTKDLTLRTSIIGPELKQNGTGLFDWFMKQSGCIDGYINVYWSGVTTLELAKAIDKAIDENITGLFQLTSNNKISKYELLSIIKYIFNKDDVHINTNYDIVSDKSMISTRDDFKYIIDSYQIMIKELYDWMKYNKDTYRHYNI